MRKNKIRRNPIRISPVFLFLFILLMPHCARLNVDVEPDATAVYFSLKLGVQVKNLSTAQSQSFKVILKYNAAGHKMMFLSPLNQVYGMLFLEGENTLLINTKKKKYWRGEFNRLIRWMWGEDMDFLFSEFKQLVVEGIIPEGKAVANGISVTVDKVDTHNKPARIQLLSQDILVKVKISDRLTGRGKLQLNTNLKGIKKADLPQVME